jgi:hypothetical protein
MTFFQRTGGKDGIVKQGIRCAYSMASHGIRTSYSYLTGDHLFLGLSLET